MFYDCSLWLLQLGTPKDYPAGKCYLDPICVDEKFRGKGIGKVLLDMAEIDAKKRGCKVDVHVLNGNMYQMINCLRILIPHSLFGCVCVCILQVIYLLVATTNRAQHLYERQGYHVIEKHSLCCCGYWCMTGERVSTLCTRWSHGHTGSYHIDRILTFNYCFYR